jgi:hypothetical protein
MTNFVIGSSKLWEYTIKFRYIESEDHWSKYHQNTHNNCLFPVPTWYVTKTYSSNNDGTPIIRYHIVYIPLRTIDTVFDNPTFIRIEMTDTHQDSCYDVSEDEIENQDLS